MIKRELYMSRIRPFIGTELVKVMTGIRRCGKSVMLELIQQELAESGVSRAQFISINFEDMSYSHLQTAQALHDEITARAAEIEGKVYLFTGSKVTGGFCVTRKGLLLPSKLGHILAALPELRDYTAEEGAFLPYKGRSYCWLSVTADGLIRLTKPMMDFLRITPGMRLLSIRSSDIAFTMGARGPLLEKADRYNGVIPEF